MSYTGSKAVIGESAVISIGPVTGTSSPTYTALGELDTFTRTGREFDMEEVTNFSSGVNKEFKKTLRNPGQVQMGGNFLDADTGQAALETAEASLSSYLFKIQYPAAPGFTTGRIETFSALVMSVDPPTITPAKVIKFASKIQITGDVAITPAVV